MVKTFLFILAIVTNEGEIKMRAVQLEACPEQNAFSENMSELRKRGEFIAWNAICYQLPTSGQGV